MNYQQEFERSVRRHEAQIAYSDARTALHEAKMRAMTECTSAYMSAICLPPALMLFGSTEAILAGMASAEQSAKARMQAALAPVEVAKARVVEAKRALALAEGSEGG